MHLLELQQTFSQGINKMSLGTYLFNPFTGLPRSIEDIESDPQGLLIWDGVTPLQSVSPTPNPLWMVENIGTKHTLLEDLIAGLEAKPHLNSYYDKLLDKAIALLKKQLENEKISNKGDTLFENQYLLDCFNIELSKLSQDAQNTIRDSVKRNESNSFIFFQSGFMYGTSTNIKLDHS